MKKGQKLWTREELILTLCLYYKLPFGKMHAKNAEVMHLAKVLNRTPGSIAFKLVNFASLDPDLQKRGVKGATNVSKLDRTIWAEFYQKWDSLVLQEEQISQSHLMIESDQPDEHLINSKTVGEDTEVIRKQRVNQHFFRKSILASYDNTCCITGIQQPQLLVAGHIKPWALDKQNRLNPHNGILLNSLHDKAFETGLITINTDYYIQVATEIRQSKDKKLTSFFLPYHNQPIILPKKYLPHQEFLAYHHNERFKG
ncbi:HNH endonuclease [uncultured Microscilla sp.]|uniref:HNH endonuclease n=1 Tax=uncultured Microscilla sp. TaxID=432653 RepID=UPI0026366A67|nr:HNH endonuclease [uncultured Microscilla sp.]